MKVDLARLADKLADGARRKVDEEEKRIDAIIANRKIPEAQRHSQPSR